MAPPVPRSSRSPSRRTRSVTPGFINPPPSEPSSPDHLTTATPISELPLPLPPSRSKSRSVTRSPSRRRRTQSPEKRQKNPSIFTTTTQPSPNRFVASTVFTPSRIGSGRVLNFNANGGSGRTGGAAIRGNGGADAGEESWRIRVVVEAERDDGSIVTGAGEPAARGRGRGRGRARVRSTTSHGSQTPRARKATPSGRGKASQVVGGGEGQEDEEARPVVVRKRRTKTDTPQTTKSRTRTVKAKTPVRGGGVAGDYSGTRGGALGGDSDSDGVDRFCDVTGEVEDEQTGCPPPQMAKGEGRDESTETRQSKSALATENLGVQADLAPSGGAPRTRRTRKSASIERGQGTSGAGESLPMRKVRAPKTSNGITSSQREEDGVQLPTAGMDWHQEGEDEGGDDSGLVTVPKTRTPGAGPANNSSGVRKRVTATSTTVGALSGSLRTSTAASEAIRQRRQARERNVTPAERVGNSVSSLDSPTLSSPNSATPLRVPKTRQAQNPSRSTIASSSPTANTSPSTQSPDRPILPVTRRVVSGGSLQSHQTVTPPPTSSPPHMHSRSPLGEMQGNRFNSVATSPQQRSTSENPDEKSRSASVGDGRGSPIYWADFAPGGDSDSSGGHDGRSSQGTDSPPPYPEKPAAPMTTVAPRQLPTPAATQSQQRIQSISLGDVDNDWLPSTPIKYIHQRTGSVASITSWPDQEEDDSNVVHQRISSVESVSHLNIDAEGPESQPGSVRRSSVVTTDSGGKRRRRIMDILPDNYESRRTLFDGVVPPRPESPEVPPEMSKRKGKQKSVGFGATVEIPSRVIIPSPPPLPAQEDEEVGENGNSGFSSSPPQQQAWEEGVGEQGPQTPGYATKPELSPDLFMPKRRYIEVSKAAVAGRRTPDLTRCRVASVVLQRTILGDLGGGDNGGIPRVFGGYLVRVDDVEGEADGGPTITNKGKARVVDVDTGDIGKGNPELVTRSVRKTPTPGPSSAIRMMGESASAVGGVKYSMLPTWRAPWHDDSAVPSLVPEDMGGENQRPLPESIPPTKDAGTNTNSNTFGNMSTAPLSSTMGTASLTNTSSNTRRYSGATGRSSVDNSLQKQLATPMKERDLRSRLLETLTRSRRKLGVRRSVTPPRSLSTSEQAGTAGDHSVDGVGETGVDVDIDALIQTHLIIQEGRLRGQQERGRESVARGGQQLQAEGVARTDTASAVTPRITRSLQMESTISLDKMPTRSMGHFPTTESLPTLGSPFSTIEPASAAHRKMTLEERWEAERQDNIRRAEEFGAIVLDDSTVTEGSIHESEVDNIDEVRRGCGKQNGDGEQEVIIKESEPGTIQGLMKSEVEEEEEEEEEEYTEEEQDSEEGEMVFRRRGLRRDFAVVPAAGIPVSPTTPIRRPLRLSQEGMVHGRGYAAHSQVSPSATKYDLPQQKSQLGAQELLTTERDMAVEGEERDKDTETSIAESAIPRPSLANRLFSGWWGNGSKPGKGGSDDDGFIEMLPAELVGRAPNPPRGHDGSESENWMLNSPSSSFVGDQSASGTYTETETGDYSGNDTYEDVEENHNEVERREEGPALYAPHTPARRLRLGTTWKTEHWVLLDELMHDLPNRNHPVTPPRSRQRYEVYKRNRLRELRGHVPSPPSQSQSQSPLELPMAATVPIQKSHCTNLNTIEPTFRVPIIGWEFNLSLPWRIGLPSRIISHLRYSPYPLRPRQPQQDPPPSPNWRQHPVFTLDHRERTVVTWFIEEAKTRFGEFWRQEIVAEMVIAWGLGRCKVSSGDAAGGVSLSGVPEEVKRRAYYGGIQIVS